MHDRNLSETASKEFSVELTLCKYMTWFNSGSKEGLGEKKNPKKTTVSQF